jgi:protoporphyrinogen oxidase
MQCKWLGERVAAPSLKTVVRNAITRTPAPNWGPNATFKFPAKGGTGGIWRAVASRLPASKHLTGKITAIDLDKREARLEDGTTVRYEKLISTVGVDRFVQLARSEEKRDALQTVREAASGLKYSSTIVIGLGMRGERPERIGDKCRSSSHSPSHLAPRTHARTSQAGSISQKTTPLSTERPSSPITPLTTVPPPPPPSPLSA